MSIGFPRAPLSDGLRAIINERLAKRPAAGARTPAFGKKWRRHWPHRDEIATLVLKDGAFSPAPGVASPLVTTTPPGYLPTTEPTRHITGCEADAVLIKKYINDHGAALRDPKKFDWSILDGKLASWEDAIPMLRIVHIQLALALKGPTVGFTLNLSNDLVARHHGERLSDVVRRRIDSQLRRALNRKVEFWFVVETPHDRPRWHLHGALGFSADEQILARDALLAASGIPISSPARQHALEFSPLHNPVGWATYASKRLASSKRKLGHSPTYYSRPLVALARGIYEFHRDCVAEQLRWHRDAMMARGLGIRRLH